MMENGGGKERKINSGPAAANHMRDGRKGLKQRFLKMEMAIQKYLITKSSWRT
jgi:hypothetical protein